MGQRAVSSLGCLKAKKQPALLRCRLLLHEQTLVGRERFERSTNGLKVRNSQYNLLILLYRRLYI